MRVGIHTGAVLAGILGQKQFEYDVYSKDVRILNPKILVADKLN